MLLHLLHLLHCTVLRSVTSDFQSLNLYCYTVTLLFFSSYKKVNMAEGVYILIDIYVRRVI